MKVGKNRDGVISKTKIKNRVRPALVRIKKKNK